MKENSEISKIIWVHVKIDWMQEAKYFFPAPNKVLPATYQYRKIQFYPFLE